jgi:hypothetical protein
MATATVLALVVCVILDIFEGFCWTPRLAAIVEF